MSVVANVAINVDATKAKAALSGLEGAIGKLGSAASQLPGKIQSGIGGLGNAINSMGGGLRNLGGQLTSLGSAAAGLGAGALVSGFVNSGIQADRTGKTIKALAGSYNEVDQLQAFAAKSAKEFGLGQTSAAKSVADLYGRLRPMGISLGDISKTFTGVNKAAALMNLSLPDTEGVLLQLSQAMGSGRLQGDELRSVMERLPAVGQAIAKTMGVTVGEIKGLGADGLITTDIIIKAMDELGKLQPPPPDAFRLLQAAMEDLSTSIGKALLPVVEPLAVALQKLSAEMEKNKSGKILADALKPIGDVLLLLLQGFMKLNPETQKLAIQFAAVAIALSLIVVPIGIVVGAIGSIIGAFSGIVTAATAVAAWFAGTSFAATLAGWLGSAGVLIAGIKTAFAVLLTWFTSTALPALIGFFSGPVGWTVLAIAAVVAMCIYFREPIGKFFIWLGTAFNNGLVAIQKWAGSIGQFFVDAWEDAKTTTGKFLTWIGNELQKAFKALGQLGYDLILKPWVDLWNNLLRDPVVDTVGWLQETWDGLVSWWTSNVIDPISKAWRNLVEFLPKAMNVAATTVRNTFAQVGNAIKGTLNAVLRGVFGAVNGAMDTINNLIKRANDLSARVRGPQLPYLPKLNIPQFAKGGMVDGPTLALVGEAGPEYIVPKSKAAGFAQNFLAGARNGAAIPRGPDSGSGPGTISPKISVTTGPVIQQGGETYVTLADLEQAMRQTATSVYANLRTPAGRYAVGTR
jgi:tape measure domain-containing protein